MNKQDKKTIMFLQTIWFTFLVVSLVACFFACIILVINSKNVAHAEDEEPVREEPVRIVSSNGYYEDNLFPNNYCTNWTYNVVSSSNTDTVFYSGEGWNYSVSGYGSLVNNTFTASGGNLVFKMSYAANTFNDSTGVSFGFGCDSPFSIYCSGAGTTYSLSNVSGVYNQSTRAYVMYSSAGYFSITLYDGVSRTLNWMCCQMANAFRGYVSPDYSYLDVSSGGSSTPNYEDISSSGVVNNNMLPNNDLSSWTYSLDNSVQQRQDRSLRSTSYFYDDGTWTYNLVDGSLQSNVFSGSNAAITFDSTDEPEQNYSAGYYTVTLGYSAFSGNVSLYFATNLMNNSIEVPLDATKSFVSITLSPPTSFVQFDIELIITGSGSVSLNFIKLERGQYFSGYVPKAYFYYGYDDGVEDGTTTVLPTDSYNLVGSILTLGTIQEFTYNGNTYVGYSAEEDSFTDTSGVRYQASYYDTQGDDTGTLLGLCVDYLFKYSVIVRTICYGTSARWERVGFKIIAIDTVDNSSYTLSRYDTSYYTEFGSIGADGTNGTYVSAEFKFSFPNNHEYRLLFVPVNHNLVDNRTLVDNASMLIFENTYFLSQANGSLSYDDYNYLIDDAYNRGLIQGRTNGYDSGYSSGYSVGYNTGSDDAGNYTFASLLGAVFDAPITAIVGKYDSDSGTRIGGLLNFNVLGVNISGFVLALLSIGVVLFILRIFLRGV